VLATVPNWQFGCGSVLELNWNRCDGLYTIKKPDRTQPPVFWQVPHFSKLWTLARIMYLSSDHIKIWYMGKRCSFRWSFTSDSPIRDPITISVSNVSGLPSCGPGLEPDRMLQSGLLPKQQGYPPGTGTGWIRTTVPFHGSYNFGSN